MSNLSVTEDDGSFAGCDCTVCTNARRQHADTLAAQAAQSAQMGAPASRWPFSAPPATAPSILPLAPRAIPVGLTFIDALAAGLGVPVGVSASAAYPVAEQPFVGPVLTQREKTLREFAARAITPIPDDECTDMGTYVIWNKWTPDCSLWLRSPRAVGDWCDTVERECANTTRPERQMEAIRQQNRRAHPDKEVRIAGWVKTDVYYLRYAPTAARQNYYAYSAGRALGRDYCYEALQRDTIAVILPRAPATVRHAAIAQMIDVLEVQSNGAGGYLLSRSIVTNLRASARYRVAATWDGGWRGIRFRPYQYAAIKRILAEVGEMLRNPYGADADEFIALANDDSMARWRSQWVEMWNDRGGDAVELEVASCGHVEYASETHLIRGGSVVCDSCFDGDYVLAEDTDEYDHRNNLHRHSDDNYYTYREDAHDDDDDDDDDDDVGGRVKGYSDNVLNYAPIDRTIVPSVYGDFLMGVELEVAPHRASLKKETVVDTMDNLVNGYGIMKNDGSLPAGGFEIVTAPRGLAEHVKRFGAWTPHHDLRAWDNGKCGLHVHMSSQAFSKGTLGKFLEFINAEENDDLIIKIAGRHPKQGGTAATYCRREGSLAVGNPKSTLAGKGTNRYHMVNTCNIGDTEAKRLGLTQHASNGKNINTVELRIFRASLKKGRLLAQIEFAHAAVMFCRWTSMRELRAEHFLKWLHKSAGMYPHLALWFGVRANTSAVDAAPHVVTSAEV